MLHRPGDDFSLGNDSTPEGTPRIWSGDELGEYDLPRFLPTIPPVANRTADADTARIGARRRRSNSAASAYLIAMACIICTIGGIWIGVSGHAVTGYWCAIAVLTVCVFGAVNAAKEF